MFSNSEYHELAEELAAAKRRIAELEGTEAASDLQAGGRGMTPEEVAARYPEVMECTGDGASWCPICGNCWCGRRVSDGERVNSASCPLHGEFSDHGTLRRPIEPETDYEALGYPETEQWETSGDANQQLVADIWARGPVWSILVELAVVAGAPEKDIRTDTDNG